jgi:lysyl endopeptidase
MNRQAMPRLIVAFIFCMHYSVLIGQISKGGTPLSISAKISTPVPIVELPTPDWDKIREEDRKGMGSFRFAFPIATIISPDNSGTWTALPNGNRIWQVKIKSKEAYGLAVSFSNFELPQGAQLFIYSPDYKQVMGAYDASNNPASKQFLGSIIDGDETIVEYIEPKNVGKKMPFTITNIYHAYNQGLLSPTDFGESLACEINVNCPQGANLQNQKRGVVRILLVVEGGMGWCSGSLIQNTKLDGKPYVLSAYHCADGYTPIYNLWTFYFNYETAGCTNPTTEPATQSLQGCVARAGSNATDFILFELNQRVPTNYNAYFNGWNRDSSNLTTKSTIIHHPKGDIKKISVDNDAPIVSNATTNWTSTVAPTTTLPRSHLVFIPDEGTSEAGSSGAPFFDANGRIIAQNHGGSVADCQINYLMGGWFAKSWDGKGTPQTRLKDWLDPMNTGVLTLNGSNTPVPTTATIGGKVQFWKGEAMPNVKVYIGNDSTITDTNGNFSFSNIALNTEVAVRLAKADNYDNGLDAIDIVRMRRHIVGVTELDSPFKYYCGDIDGNNDVDAIDYILIKRVIVGINSGFTATTPWRFVSQQTSTNPAFPFGISEPSPVMVNFTGNVSNFNFYGYKKGDIDGSANLGQ